MKKTIITLLIVLLLPVLAGSLSAQGIRDLTLDKSLNIAFKNSYQILDVQQDIKRDMLRVKGNKSALKSYANFEFDLPNFSESITEEFNSQNDVFEFVRTRKMQYETRLNISQPLPTNGNFSLNQNFLRFSQSSSAVDYSNRIFLSLSQPLFTPNRLKRNIRNSELNYERTEARGLNKKLNTIYNITRQFYSLYKQNRNYQIDSSSVAKQVESYNTAKQKYKTGNFDRIDLLQLEVDLARSRDRLFLSRRSLLQGKNNFKHLIGIDLSEDIVLITDLKYSPIKIDLETAVRKGLEFNPGIKLNELWKESAFLSIINTDSYREFKGSLVASYGYEKSDHKIDNIFSDFDQTRTLYFYLFMPLWDWGQNRAYVEAQESNLSEAELWTENAKVTIRRDVEVTVRRVNVALARLDMLKECRTLAHENYSLGKEKFDKGRLKSQEFSLIQNEMNQIERRFLDAYIEYRLALADLKRKTFYDFETNQNMQDVLNRFNRVDVSAH